MIDLGDVVRIGAEVRDAGGALTDPATAVLTVILPDGTAVSPAVPLPSAVPGEVRVDYGTVQAGRHVWRLVTTGPAGAHADSFDVVGATVGVVSLARVKRHLGIEPEDTGDDEDLREWIAAATEAIADHLGTAVIRATVTERQMPDRGGQFMLRQVPVIDVTAAVSPDGARTWDTGGLDVDGESGIVSGLRTGGSPVDVTYTVGPAGTSGGVQQAALIIVQHLWETRRGAMRVPRGGDDDAWMPGRGFAIPRRAVELLGTTLPGIA